MAALIEINYANILSLYKGACDNKTDDVNPFSSTSEFENATVGALRWGTDGEVRKRSKLRLATNLSAVFEKFKISLSADSIYSSLVDEKKNSALVTEWVNKL